MPSPSDYLFSFGPTGTPREPEDPMRLLVLGDFSGQSATARRPLAERPTIAVDLDNLDATIARLAPRIVTEAGAIDIASLDDFHPDALFAKVALFRDLRDARSKPAPSGQDSTFAALLGGGAAAKSAAPTPTPGSGPGGLDALLQRVVAPHIVPDTSAQSKVYLNAIDAAVAEQMRKLLHTPAFQAVEAAWRGVQLLISGMELGENLQLHLVDIGRDELVADLGAAAGGDVKGTATFGALANRRRQSGGQGWSAIVALHPFTSSPSDLAILAALGAVASHAGGPLIAGTDGADWPADAPAWTALRASEAARWIGLVSPRLLMRRPYGARSEPVEAFAFEELGNRPAHADYLWGSGALACALLLGRAYGQAEGWSFSVEDEREIGDLPSCTQLDADGEPELVPCAEWFWPDTTADAVLASGLMPLLSHRHRNVALLMRFLSIAKPQAPLNGLPA